MINPEQIRAARALLGLDQAEVARRAYVSIATLRRVANSADKPRASMRAVKSIQHAREAAGAGCVDNGVRGRRRRSPEEGAGRVRTVSEFGARSARMLAE